MVQAAGVVAAPSQVVSRTVVPRLSGAPAHVTLLALSPAHEEAAAMVEVEEGPVVADMEQILAERDACGVSLCPAFSAQID